MLRREIDAKIYPKLPQVIGQDAAIFLGEDDIDFDKMFNRYEDDEKYISFYKAKKDYYGKYYGFSDVIYAVAKLFENSSHKIPKYAQVVVDEFQDFNNAEVTLIELLAGASPILLAGDDDQSLYIDLKNASPDYIRDKYGVTASDYEAFPLPFCSRSTRVIVEAVNNVVDNAKQHGLLKGRVPKPYRYFRCPKKDAESAAHPKIVYTQQYEGEMPFFFQNEIAKLAKHERGKFSVLVIVPPQMGKRLLPKFAKELKKKGFRNVTFPTRSVGGEPTLMEGLRILLDNKDDNLGYRIVAKHILDVANFEKLLRKCAGEEKVSDHLSEDDQKKIKRLLRTLKKIRDDKDVDQANFDELL
jgi:superfamily I DNA/RNA helicase